MSGGRGECELARTPQVSPLHATIEEGGRPSVPHGGRCRDGAAPHEVSVTERVAGVQRNHRRADVPLAKGQAGRCPCPAVPVVALFAFR
jgi:hypothetical protein